MPTYDYECPKCKELKEVFHKMSEMPSVKCSKCRKDMVKKISGGAGVIYKGSGFYTTDYKNKNNESGK